MVGVLVTVAVRVRVEVLVALAVKVPLGVLVGVWVGVPVCVGVWLGVAVGRSPATLHPPVQTSFTSNTMFGQLAASQACVQPTDPARLSTQKPAPHVLPRQTQHIACTWEDGSAATNPIASITHPRITPGGRFCMSPLPCSELQRPAPVAPGVPAIERSHQLASNGLGA